MQGAAVAKQEWAIWHAVPAGYSGVWRAVDARGWTYFGEFSHGHLVCGMGLDPSKDEDTKAAWLALMELTLGCHEPRMAPVLPTQPRVLPFPARQSVGA